VGYWILEGQNAFIRIAVRNFLDPDLPAPTMEFYVKLRHRWVPPAPAAEQFETFPTH
jgi:hypothetical protein